MINLIISRTRETREIKTNKKGIVTRNSKNWISFTEKNIHGINYTVSLILLTGPILNNEYFLLNQYLICIDLSS